MEEKKQIKVSLGAVISVFIIILLTVALVGMYCYYNFVVIPKYEVANNEKEQSNEVDEQGDLQNGGKVEDETSKTELAITNIEGKECLNFTGIDVSRKYTMVDNNEENTNEFLGINISKSMDEKLYLTFESEDSYKSLNSIISVNKSIEWNKNYEITNINVSDIKSVFVGKHGNGVGLIAFFLMKDGTVEWLNLEDALTNKNFVAEGKIEGITNIVKISKANVGEYYKVSNDGAGWISVIGIQQDGNFYDLVDETVNFEYKIKRVLQNYLDLMDAYEGTPAHLLYKSNLMTEDEFNKILGSNTYCKTDIKFSEYKEAMLNYVSENWFNQKFATLYNKTSDANEYLEFEHLGTSIGSNKVESVTIKGDYNALTYIAKVYTIASDGVKGDTYNVEFTLENFVENNKTKTVISYCDELKY